MAIAFKGETQKGTGEPIVYPLLPWKWLGSVVALVVALSLYADDVGLLFGFTVTDQQLIRYLPPVLLGALLLAPLALHVVTASISAVGASRSKRAYVLALGAAIAVHVAYNLTVVSVLV